MHADKVSHRGDPPHLLYVAWGYPPSRGAGMYRALATANAFVRQGWNVTVLTATRDAFERLTGSDPASEDRIDPRVNVVRVPFDTVYHEANLARWSRMRVFSPLLWDHIHSRRESRGFPEPRYARWLRPLVSAARRVHATRPVNLVIGSANPNVDFMPGHELHRRFGVPYVMDYRDGWTLDVYTGERAIPVESKASQLEQRLIHGAEEAWFVNQPIRDWYAREYPDRAGRFHVVANGFDPEFIDGATIRQGAASRSRERALTFGYLGTIYGPIPLRETLEGWRLARERSPLIAESKLVFHGQIGHFVEKDVEVERLLAEFSDDGVEYAGPVSKTRVSEVYASVDALLLVVSHSPFVTSGKVFEYAATGLPIASLHHPETGATSVLGGRPRWFPASGVSAQAFADAIIATGEHTVRSNDSQMALAQAWAAHLARDAQLSPRLDALRQTRSIS